MAASTMRWNVRLHPVGVDVLIDPSAQRHKGRPWGTPDSRKPSINRTAVTPLSQAFGLPAPLKGSPWILHRLKPPLEGRWRAQRDGEVLGQLQFPQVWF